jgi:hypothetical protein
MKLSERFHETFLSPAWPRPRVRQLGKSALPGNAPFSSELMSVSPIVTEIDLHRLQLSDALSKLETTDGKTAEQTSAERYAAIVRTNELIAQVLPPEEARRAGVYIDPDTAARPILMAELYLLAMAADYTKEEGIAVALEYALRTAPLSLSEELAEAYEEATRSSEPIMTVLSRTRDRRDAKQDRPHSAGELQVVLDMRDATPPEMLNPAWEARLRRLEEDD